MNQKDEITKRVLELLGVEASDDRVRKTIPAWWCSVRQKDQGGMRLTEQGFDSFIDAGIKDYRIKFDNPIIFTNQLIIWLDHFIDCPFYLRNQEIYVFSEKMAVQLVLFSGNIYNFSVAKSRSHSS